MNKLYVDNFVTNIGSGPAVDRAREILTKLTDDFGDRAYDLLCSLIVYRSRMDGPVNIMFTGGYATVFIEIDTSGNAVMYQYDYCDEYDYCDDLKHLEGPVNDDKISDFKDWLSKPGHLGVDTLSSLNGENMATAEVATIHGLYAIIIHPGDDFENALIEIRDKPQYDIEYPSSIVLPLLRGKIRKALDGNKIHDNTRRFLELIDGVDDDVLSGYLSTASMIKNYDSIDGYDFSQIELWDRRGDGIRTFEFFESPLDYDYALLPSRFEYQYMGISPAMNGKLTVSELKSMLIDKDSEQCDHIEHLVDGVLIKRDDHYLLTDTLLDKNDSSDKSRIFRNLELADNDDLVFFVCQTIYGDYIENPYKTSK